MWHLLLEMMREGDNIKAVIHPKLVVAITTTFQHAQASNDSAFVTILSQVLSTLSNDHVKSFIPTLEDAAALLLVAIDAFMDQQTTEGFLKESLQTFKNTVSQSYNNKKVSSDSWTLR